MVQHYWYFFKFFPNWVRWVHLNRGADKSHNMVLNTLQTRDFFTISQIIHKLCYSYKQYITWVIDGYCIIKEKRCDFWSPFQYFQINKTFKQFLQNFIVDFAQEEVGSVFFFGFARVALETCVSEIRSDIFKIEVISE